MTVQQPFDDFINALVLSGVGSMIGTAFKFIRHPPRSASHFFLKGFCAIGIGTLAGGISQEWFSFGPWVCLSGIVSF
jgi:hypothetical protein